MRTDEELLKLAASQAGAEWISGRWVALRDDCVWHSWDPLNDDGDALRLAVKLGMRVDIDNHPDGCACSEAESFTHPDGTRAIYNHTDEQDQYAATRRAIVRVAAEIGAQVAEPAHNEIGGS